MKGRKNWLKKLLPVRQQVGRQVWAAGCASRVWGKEHNWGIYVGNIKLSVLLESVPVPGRWL